MYITAYDLIQTQTQFDTIFLRSTQRRTDYRRLLLTRSVSERREANDIKESKKVQKLHNNFRTEAHHTISFDTEWLQKAEQKTAKQGYVNGAINLNKVAKISQESARSVKYQEPKKTLVVKNIGNIRTEVKDRFSSLDVQKLSKTNFVRKQFQKKGKKLSFTKYVRSKVLTQKKNSQKNQILSNQDKKKPCSIKLTTKKLQWFNFQNIDPWQTKSQFDEEFIR